MLLSIQQPMYTKFTPIMPRFGTILGGTGTVFVPYLVWNRIGLP